MYTASRGIMHNVQSSVDSISIHRLLINILVESLVIQIFRMQNLTLQTYPLSKFRCLHCKSTEREKKNSLQQCEKHKETILKVVRVCASLRCGLSVWCHQGHGIAKSDFCM